MFAGILAGVSKAGLSLLGTLLTEALFKKTLARLTVYLIERLVASTETKLDDKAAVPFINKLKKEY